jgi:hypothetical protein
MAPYPPPINPMITDIFSIRSRSGHCELNNAPQSTLGSGWHFALSEGAYPGWNPNALGAELSAQRKACLGIIGRGT